MKQGNTTTPIETAHFPRKSELPQVGFELTSLFL